SDITFGRKPNIKDKEFSINFPKVLHQKIKIKFEHFFDYNKTVVSSLLTESATKEFRSTCIPGPRCFVGQYSDWWFSLSSNGFSCLGVFLTLVSSKDINK